MIRASAPRIPGLWMLAGALLVVTACVPRGPVVDTTSKPEGVGGTIAGAVRADGGAVPLAGRIVTAINEATGARFSASTAVSGGYTLKVPAGMYRLDVELRPGETVQSRPDPTQVNVGDLDPDRDFVLTVK